MGTWASRPIAGRLGAWSPPAAASGTVGCPRRAATGTATGRACYR